MRGEGITGSKEFTPEFEASFNIFESFLESIERKSKGEAIKFFHAWTESHAAVVQHLSQMSAEFLPKLQKIHQLKTTGLHAMLRAAIRSTLIRELGDPCTLLVLGSVRLTRG